MRARCHGTAGGAVGNDMSHEGGWPRDRTVPTKVPLDSTPPTTTYITRLRSTAAPAEMPSAQEAARADGVAAESEGGEGGGGRIIYWAWSWPDILLRREGWCQLRVSSRRAFSFRRLG